MPIEKISDRILQVQHPATRLTSAKGGSPHGPRVPRPGVSGAMAAASGVPMVQHRAAWRSSCAHRSQLATFTRSDLVI